MFISRNPQSVALHGGHLVRACPDFQEKYDEQFRPSFRGRAIFPDRIELNREKPAALKSGLGRTGVEMHREDLLCPDLLSEIILLGFGELIFVSLILFLMAVLTRA